MDQLNVGIVGAGWIAAVHANSYRDSPGVRVTAVTDPVPAKAERVVVSYCAGGFFHSALDFLHFS